MARPIAAADRAGDQPVLGRGIGDAEQRLGEAEKQHPLLARQPVFMQQRIDAALLAPSVARALDEVAGEKLDPAPLVLACPRLGDQRLDQRGLFGEQGRADRLAGGQCGNRADVALGLAHDASLTLRASWFETRPSDAPHHEEVAPHPEEGRRPVSKDEARAAWPPLTMAAMVPALGDRA